MPKTKIVLATIGSLGDLHPFIAVGHALQHRGFEPVLAVPKSYVAKGEKAGIESHPIFPSFEEAGAMLGMPEAEATRRMIRDPDYLIRKLMLHYLPESARALDKISEGAAAIASTVFSIAGPIIAEKRKLPLISCLLQPMTMMSAMDPPQSPDFWMLAKPPLTPAKLRYNRMMMRMIRFELRRRYAKRVNAVRRDFGLAPAAYAPVFDTPPGARLVLGLYSDVLGRVQPDYPPDTQLTGFPVFDSDSGAPERLDPELAAFLTNGEPPIVFTLGSFAVYAPGDFYRESMGAALKLRRRALLLTGPGEPPPPHPSVLSRAYAPHSMVFRHASAIVHHGGIGTTGAALRAGKPQLVVPHMGDEWDNGARIVRLGVGAMLPAKRYSGDRAAQIIATFDTDNTTRSRAMQIGRHVREEHGGDRAADAIALALAGEPPHLG